MQTSLLIFKMFIADSNMKMLQTKLQNSLSETRPLQLLHANRRTALRIKIWKRQTVKLRINQFELV